MKHLCYSCKIYKDCHHGLTSAGIIAGCPHYEKLVVTNADRIRSMDDDELVDELLEWFACFTAVEWSRDMILNWLKKEVKT